MEKGTKYLSKALKKSYTAINHPKVILIKLLQFISPLLNDRIYLKLIFRLKAGYRLNLKQPTTYNEKLQWLKLYYKSDLLPKLVDKFEYKLYVANLIGQDFVPKNYGIWDSFDQIDFSKLPDKFVLKTTHDQGGVILCLNKKKLDIETAKKKLNHHIKRNIFYLYREWPYKTVPPRIIAEELLVNENGDDLRDYKFYCFHGEPKVMYVSSKQKEGKGMLDFFDMDFNYLDIRRPGYNRVGNKLERPKNFETMISLAKLLAGNEPHVRIDFYDVNGKIYVGEYTLFQGGGMMPFIPKKWDYILGGWINLSSVNKLEHS